MLLKFSSSDMLNTDLADPRTNQVKYTIVSRAVFLRGKRDEIVGVASRTTKIVNAQGEVIAQVEWAGHDKRRTGDIIFMDELPIRDFSELFDGCASVLRHPEELRIPSRLDYTWLATRTGLTLLDSDTDSVSGRLYEKCVQVGDKMVHVPALGTNYLELPDQSDRVIAELLVDYILMDIMRRARFNLTKYDFSQHGKLERGKEIMMEVSRRLAIGRKIRRNTI